MGLCLGGVGGKTGHTYVHAHMNTHAQLLTLTVVIKAPVVDGTSYPGG